MPTTGTERPDRLDMDCVLWTGKTNAYGYGIKPSGKRATWTLVHREVWEQAHGQPVPARQVVRHTCDTPACINPEHLVLGTQADNVRDMIERGRAWWQKRTECPNGHPYSDTAIIRSNGHRKCRECHNEALRRYRSKNKSTTLTAAAATGAAKGVGDG